MPCKVYLCLLIGFAGCGNTIGALDSLPSGPDVSGVAWPLLVDTPEPPEERLMAGTGAQAITRLNARRTAVDGRLASAAALPPVSDVLLTRAESSRSRVSVGAGPAVNEADLLARAESLRQRTDLQSASAATQNFDEAALLARAERARQQSSLAFASAGEADLQNRANISGLRKNQPQAASAFDAASATFGPRAPVPLRPLDTPVVSNSFEQRARLAQARAKQAGL